MAKPKKIGFWTGASELWPLVLILVGGAVSYYWVVYAHPAKTQTVQVNRNVVATERTTKPDGTITIREERDLTTVNEASHQSPVLLAARQWGISVALSPSGEKLGTASYEIGGPFSIHGGVFLTPSWYPEKVFLGVGLRF